MWTWWIEAFSQGERMTIAVSSSQDVLIQLKSELEKHAPEGVRFQINCDAM